MTCSGVEGHSYSTGQRVQVDGGGDWLADRITGPNVAESRRLWHLVDPGYEPIDWQLDFKSGWRWSEATWYRDVEYGTVAGADVKVPWELARMQHLPQLALAGTLARAGLEGFESPERYEREFRNEIIDFISTNPPRFGVNWATTMDVAIRVSNWLVAYDLFRASGAEFDADFESVLGRSVLEHGLHIASNLEWREDLRSNHYLADIVGLLFVAAYLPRSGRTDTWLAFATQELATEAGTQFLDDGANFEASTSYHRLSAELVTYSVAILLGLPQERVVGLQQYDHRLWRSAPRLRPGPVPLYRDAVGRSSPVPPWLVERLERMAEFSIDSTKPNGRVVQIGDNDSGRFLKLVPLVRIRETAAMVREHGNLPNAAAQIDPTYWQEEHLDHRQLVGAINGLYHRMDFAKFTLGLDFETSFVAGVSRTVVLPRNHSGRHFSESVQIGSIGELDELERRITSLLPNQNRVVHIELGGGFARDGLVQAGYPDFGLFVFQSHRVYLAIRCGPQGQGGFGGHAHNDQLGIELNVDGQDWIRDAGTYLYTPSPAHRDRYRSTNAHFTPRIDGAEPAGLDLGLFELRRGTNATCLYWGPAGFAGQLAMPGGRFVWCVVRLADDSVTLIHGCEGARLIDGGSVPSDWRAMLSDVPFSPGYGWVERGTD